jgi:uncharacterized protein YceK
VIRRVAVLLAAALLIGGCGTISAAQAMASWVKQSNYIVNSKTLLADVEHAANALRSTTSSNVELHTVCAVLFTDDGHAEQALPTPDAQATALLNRAYADFANGANQCYEARQSARARASALALLVRGVATLSEASARVSTAVVP